MPLLYTTQTDPNDYFRSQKRIFNKELQNKQTGFIGTLKGDVDSFNALIKQFENVENNLEAYIPTLEKLIQAPDRAVAGSTNDLFISLNTAKKAISKISLKALPLTDIDTIKAYNDSFENYDNVITGYTNSITATQLGLAPAYKNVFNKTEVDLQKISDDLSILTQSITAQIRMYDSGVAQPVKFGGNMYYNLDNPKSSIMYQTPPTNEYHGYGKMPLRYM
jgi:hypothetical protein